MTVFIMFWWMKQLVSTLICPWKGLGMMLPFPVYHKDPCPEVITRTFIMSRHIRYNCFIEV